MDELRPGSTIGIVGGGQLGRMLAMAAARLGFRVVVLDPDPNAPASQVANHHLLGSFDDQAALDDLASQSDVVTYEFENVSVDQLLTLAGDTPVHPRPAALRISQDRLVEKDYVNSLGTPTAEYIDIASQADLEDAVVRLGGRAIVKTRRFGYDGKGQLRIDGDVPVDGFERLGSVPLIAEGFVDFVAEISVIGARSVRGDCVFYEPALNEHVDGILSTSTVPSGVGAETIEAAIKMTEGLLHGLDYVGVIGVEFFVLNGGAIVLNEFAPRVHNSGHWTEAACLCSQFEQHVRAVAGLSLGSSARHSDAEMRNLIGESDTTAEALIASGEWMVNLYGKVEARPGRKMGHATRLG